MRVSLTWQAQRIRTRQTKHHLRVLADVHFIASPATFCTAPLIPKGAVRSGYSNLPLTGRLMQASPLLAYACGVARLQGNQRMNRCCKASATLTVEIVRRVMLSVSFLTIHASQSFGMRITQRDTCSV